MAVGESSEVTDSVTGATRQVSDKWLLEMGKYMHFITSQCLFSYLEITRAMQLINQI